MERGKLNFMVLDATWAILAIILGTAGRQGGPKIKSFGTGCATISKNNIQNEASKKTFKAQVTSSWRSVLFVSFILFFAAARLLVVGPRETRHQVRWWS